MYTSKHHGITINAPQYHHSMFKRSIKCKNAKLELVATSLKALVVSDRLPRHSEETDERGVCWIPSVLPKKFIITYRFS